MSIESTAQHRMRVHMLCWNERLVVCECVYIPRRLVHMTRNIGNLMVILITDFIIMHCTVFDGCGGGGLCCDVNHCYFRFVVVVITRFVWACEMIRWYVWYVSGEEEEQQKKTVKENMSTVVRWRKTDSFARNISFLPIHLLPVAIQFQFIYIVRRS